MKVISYRIRGGMGPHISELCKKDLQGKIKIKTVSKNWLFIMYFVPWALSQNFHLVISINTSYDTDKGRKVILNKKTLQKKLKFFKSITNLFWIRSHQNVAYKWGRILTHLNNIIYNFDSTMDLNFKPFFISWYKVVQWAVQLPLQY